MHVGERDASVVASWFSAHSRGRIVGGVGRPQYNRTGDAEIRPAMLDVLFALDDLTLVGRRRMPCNGVYGIRCEVGAPVQTGHNDYKRDVVGPEVLASDDDVPLSLVWGPAAPFDMLLGGTTVELGGTVVRVPRGWACVLRADCDHGGGGFVSDAMRVHMYLPRHAGQLPQCIYSTVAPFGPIIK